MMATFAVTGTLLAEWPVNLAFAEITGWWLRRCASPVWTGCVNRCLTPWGLCKCATNAEEGWC